MRWSKYMSESRTKLLVMCRTHGGVILKNKRAKLRGNDQINRLRPGEIGMHKRISDIFFGGFSLEVFPFVSSIWLSFNLVPYDITPGKAQAVLINSQHETKLQTKIRNCASRTQANYWSTTETILSLLEMYHEQFHHNSHRFLKCPSNNLIII